ncbi:MAG: oxygenase MpaB family protein, partial [Acidimicrobiia bacterium]|nr:oxygenase MpaB family protein [Acidimicrobiia bacterium]
MGDDLRGWLGEQIRWRLVGAGDERRREQLVESDEPGWFDEDAPIRRVHGDASMFVGGLRALLLQSLHPLAMAGVAQHSDFRNDPWGRLHRTVDFLTATTFGPASEAELAVERVRAVHSTVRGTAVDGLPYSADDPYLLRWVHVAEVDSFLTAYDRYGRSKLSKRDRDHYLADAARVANALGAVDPPRSGRDLKRQLREYRGELRGTKEARDAA